MIACPLCGSPTGVRETRDEKNHVRRRRSCTNVTCKGRVTTFELVVPDPRAVPEPMIVSRKFVEGLAAQLRLPIDDPDDD